MNEKPLERLHYFNGQRLQAADLTLEQDYHLRIRRWLNRSLYSAGIADGLIVNKVPGVPRVRIGPGLALDSRGREIILIDEHEEPVPGAHDDNNLPLGLYLSIRYAEEIIARQDASCVPRSGAQDKLAWGGPSRVLAEPLFDWSRELPHEDSGKVLLAYVALGKGCKEVNLLDVSVRRYVGAASAAKVKQYALEGVRDINKDNTARIYFHIRGRQPSAVTLYLRAELMPTLYYTEMGHHKHPISVTVNDLNIPPHTHGTGATGATGGHTPNVNSIVANADASAWNGVLGVVGGAAAAAVVAGAGVNPSANAFAIAVGATSIAKFVDDGVNPDRGFMNLTMSPHFFRSHNDQDMTNDATVNMRITLDPVADHAHSIEAFPNNGNPVTIALSGQGQSDEVGAETAPDTKYEARTGDPLKYVDDLKISIDGRPCTLQILEQIANNQTDEVWTTIGDGNSNHALVIRGTGAIRIDYIPGVVLSEAEHYIELSVTGTGNGGRIHYNLYVE